MGGPGISGWVSATVFMTAMASLGGSGGGCALPNPDTLLSPTPLSDNRGKYPCPYIASGELAPWAARALKSDRSPGRAGAMATGMAIGAVPVAGDLFAEKAEQDMNRSNAMKAAGGLAFMRASSDQSFDKLDDLAVWHYVNYSTVPEFKQLQKLLVELYPYFADNYGNAVRHAKRKPAGSVEGSG